METFLLYIQEKALTNKYTKWYCNIIKNSVCDPITSSGRYENHHILPKSFKLYFTNIDINSTDNIVKLTPKQHFLCHLLLTKMFTGIMNKKMNYAFYQLRLSNKHQTRYVNSRFYEKIKKIKRDYVRIYKSDKIKYVDKDDNDLIDKYINEGWSTIMTNEYKIGRVGNMKGRKHSQNTKQKISNALKLVSKLNLNLTPEQRKTNGIKSAETRKLKQQINPDCYKNSIISRVQKTKQLYKDGILSMKGNNNPRYGVVVSDDTKKKIAAARERKYNGGFTIAELYVKVILPQINNNIDIKHIKLPGGCKKTKWEVKQIIKKYSPLNSVELLNDEF